MVDFLWREERVIVETDGAEVHGTATAQRDDARRDHVLTSLGYRVLRVSYDELTRMPDMVARDLRRQVPA